MEELEDLFNEDDYSMIGLRTNLASAHENAALLAKKPAPNTEAGWVDFVSQVGIATMCLTWKQTNPYSPAISETLEWLTPRLFLPWIILMVTVLPLVREFVSPSLPLFPSQLSSHWRCKSTEKLFQWRPTVVPTTTQAKVSWEGSEDRERGINRSGTSGSHDFGPTGPTDWRADEKGRELLAPLLQWLVVPHCWGWTWVGGGLLSRHAYRHSSSVLLFWKSLKLIKRFENRDYFRKF